MRRATTLLATACACVPSVAQVIHPETEPNNTKAAANGPLLLMPGDTITGHSTGTSTTIPGPASADYFLVRTAPAPSGIYRRRLVLTTAEPGQTHTGSLLGRWNTCTCPQDMQTVTSSAPLALQWYGFGQGDQIYFKVVGNAASTSQYTATYHTAPVTPVDLGVFPGGYITITTVGQGHATNTDLWVYNSGLYSMIGFGNNDEPAPGGTLQSRLMRDFTAPGVYYLAITSHDLVNEQPRPTEDRVNFHTPVLDFGAAALTSDAAAPLDVSFAIIDGAGQSYVFSATKEGPFDIAWFRFTLTAPSVGACCFPEGTCVDQHTAPYCAAMGGVYRGDGSDCQSIACEQPPTGACCMPAGGCLMVSSYVCAQAGMTWHGAGTPCASVVCAPPFGCYPNCDGSTQPPALNVADFTCFLSRYSSGEPYGNCDESTTAPILNVGDFTCFLQRFAAGCR